MAKKKKDANPSEITTEQKLRYLYDLQMVDNEMNKITILRGELPLEVSDLEDELAGLSTRIENLESDVKELDNSVVTKKNEIIAAQAAIKKYEEQQKNVRNNREYDSLSKEIEFQGLEIQLCEKKIREFTAEADKKKEIILAAKQNFEDRSGDLALKRSELDNIVSETKAEEDKLAAKLEEIEQNVEERYLTAYKRIKSNARNGLVVVSVQRNACGGCFNKIPPQRQADIRLSKQIIVCEYCGRILVSDSFDENNAE